MIRWSREAWLSDCHVPGGLHMNAVNISCIYLPGIIHVHVYMAVCDGVRCYMGTCDGVRCYMGVCDGVRCCMGGCEVLHGSL